MTTQELIDEHLLYQEGLPITDLRARRKFKRNLQRAADYIWNLRDFAFAMFTMQPLITNIVSAGVTRTGLEILETDAFVRLGPHGVVTLDERPLQWVPIWRMEQFYQMRPGAGGQPCWYTDPVTPGSGLTTPGSRFVLIYPALPSTAGHTATIAYKTHAPRLQDNGASPPETGDEMSFWPEQWQRSLLYELGVLYEMKDKGNIQAIRLQQSIVNENLRNFLAVERSGASSVLGMTPFAPPRRQYR